MPVEVACQERLGPQMLCPYNQNVTMLSMSDFYSVLGEFKKKFSGQIVHHEILPIRPPQFSEFPVSVPSELIEALRQRGIRKPYTHQALAWEKLAAGKNVVVITPTASGKTLCYNVPVVQQILKESTSRALYLFPTKALSQDQLAELQVLLDRSGLECVNLLN